MTSFLITRGGTGSARLFRGVKRRGFTLIELLIVVAIIAILAAIAVPNFLESQTRAKASRTRADMRTIAGALEMYAVDHNDYPPNNPAFQVLPNHLSTPIAYLTNPRIVDIFNEKEFDPVYGILTRYYTYNRIVFQKDIEAGLVRKPDFREPIDGPAHNLGAFEKYGDWRLVSVGPDRNYIIPTSPDPVLKGSDIRYDPTNGSVSWGNILRTQKRPE
jgi:prepilin-type N-terminal cleavage/methylation domain-containing protein